MGRGRRGRSEEEQGRDTRTWSRRERRRANSSESSSSLSFLSPLLLSSVFSLSRSSFLSLSLLLQFCVSLLSFFFVHALLVLSPFLFLPPSLARFRSLRRVSLLLTLLVSSFHLPSFASNLTCPHLSIASFSPPLLPLLFLPHPCPSSLPLLLCNDLPPYSSPLSLTLPLSTSLASSSTLDPHSFEYLLP